MGENDVNRPVFERSFGQIGIYMDIIEAVPKNKDEYGLRHYYIQDLEERFLSELQNTRLDKIKGLFEKQRIWKGVIIESFDKGIVMKIGLNDMEAIEEVWSQHQTNQLQDILQSTLVGYPMKENLRITDIRLRVRLYEDEYKGCKNELSLPDSKFNLVDKPNDLYMLRLVKTFQKQQIEPQLQNFHKGASSINNCLSELLLGLKRFLPKDIVVESRQHLISLVEDHLRGKKYANLDLINKFCQILGDVVNFWASLTEGVLYPLAQVHMQCESPSQRQFHKDLRDRVNEATNSGKIDFNWTKMKHGSILRRILPKESERFSGLCSILPILVDKLDDFDHDLHEYLSSFPIAIQVL
ncbi:DgyrCDS11991 [Dimorphilus gyrociliatus]|uniref:DgyrCDS11991 n=1 Tax=Dimorphilus gyrociliatus TaxID=2664684 RepID=A0A7I8W542_9ANNE|nr:DgyrCDS11991 [Dimorphilus gyrociliatus]